MLTREELLRLAEHKNIKREPVPEVPGLFVRLMTGAEVEAYDLKREALKESKASGVRIVSELIAATACDENGELLFSGNDVEQVVGLPVNILESIASAAARLNKLDDGAVEGLEKN